MEGRKRERREEGLHLNNILFMISSEPTGMAFTPVLGNINLKKKRKVGSKWHNKYIFIDSSL